MLLPSVVVELRVGRSSGIEFPLIVISGWVICFPNANAANPAVSVELSSSLFTVASDDVVEIIIEEKKDLVSKDDHLKGAIICRMYIT